MIVRNRVTTWLLFFAVASGFVASRARAAVTATRDPGNDKLVVMENETIKMIVDTSNGGAVISFVHKPLGKDVIPSGRPDKMGLFLDHYWRGGWPGELMLAPYDAEIQESGPDEAALRMECTIKGHDDKGDYPAVRGLVLRKILTLRSNVDAVLCGIAISNPTGTSKLITYWHQQYFFAGGDYDEKGDAFVRPSTRGVLRHAKNYDGLIAFTRDPFAGWTAGEDTKKRAALVWLMDFNYLNSLYHCHGNETIEWLYDKAIIPPGRTWQTEIVLIPVYPIQKLALGSRELVAGLQIERDGNDLHLTHYLRDSLTPVEDLRLSVELEGVTDRKTRKLEELAIGSVGKSVKVFSQTIRAAPADPLVVKVTASGKSAAGEFAHLYWDFYGGTYGYGGNVGPDMMTPLYTMKAPAKEQKLMKPDVIERHVQSKPLCFWREGLTSRRYRPEQSLALAGASGGPGGVRTRGEYSISTYGSGPGISNFPVDYDLIMKYDAIAAANVNVDGLGLAGKEVLYDYLTHGGSLLVLGGKAAYGARGWRDSKLADLLPVEVAQGKFDIEKIDDGNLALAEAHRITDGLSVKDKPRVEFLHRARVKKGAEVLLTAGGKPFLVVWEYKGARIACVLGAPYGEDEAGAGPLFFSWDDWPKLMANTLLWLGRRDKPRPNPGSGGR